jgi:hypothetical protein
MRVALSTFRVEDILRACSANVEKPAAITEFID